ncbi:ribonuclease P protein component [Pelistega europaea]|uniref:Ribonuclease P protein component n=1 Tax=Pelistega europaea TaxID=106147 RepID=A0A7Y4P558_9BURK|nr:ribonuclease P protein component [Pelistega europaea]NOL48539.1 ribonuclease P protein component [Pelistega europaea]
MSSANYPKEARLHRPSEFAAVFSNKRVTRGALFTLHQSTHPLETARLGLVIAKKNAPRAVTRSTIKRVVREIFRQRRHQLPPKDFVVRLHRVVVPCSLRELRQKVRQDVEPLFDRWQK